MSRNIFYFFFIAVIISGCSENFKFYTKVINDVNSKYKFNTIESDYDDLSASFYFIDVAHDNLSMNEMQSLAININEYIINKYPKIDSLKFRNYIFSGAGGFEVAEFTIDQNKKLVKSNRMLD